MIVLKKRFLSCLILVFIFFISCDNDSRIQTYSENTALKEKKDINIATAKPQAKNIEWKTPKGWIEKKGKGLRLATFEIRSGEADAFCTIVPLAGDGGGLLPNVSRWLNQLKISFNSDDEFDKFLSKQERFQTVYNHPAIFVDFTTLTSNPADVSMFVTVISLKKRTVFIKMTGKKYFLIEKKEVFLKLSRSIK
jgi:hypothetical protein